MNTIISKKTENKKVLLNTEQTEKFIKSIDIAMHSFTYPELFKVIQEFKIKITSDIFDFLIQAKVIFKISDRETIVKKVTPFQTKCIFCSLGKTVNGYEILSVLKDCEKVCITTKTALYFDIVDGELYDFGWCNAFLSKEEVEDINN